MYSVGFPKIIDMDMKECIFKQMVLWFTLAAFLLVIAPSSAINSAESKPSPASVEARYARCIVTTSSDKKLTADLSFTISLTTGGNPAGTIVWLTGQELPFLEISQVVPQSGVTVFFGVPEGNYLIVTHKAGFYDYSTLTNISANSTFEILLQELRFKPLNLSVDGLTLNATWDDPKDIVIHENFEDTIFPPIGWQALTQNVTGWYSTTDGSNQFFAIPPHSTYAVVSNEEGNGDGCCDYLITPEMDWTNLPDYKLTFSGFYTAEANQLATIEISTDGGSSWSVIFTMQPSPLSWQEIELDLSAYSGPEGLSNVLLAFHADDSGNSSSGWAIDDVMISSGEIPVLGYGVFLDGLLLSYTSDRTYAFDQELNYGQHYTAGVAALYSSGYSEPDTCNFTSRFLFPPLNFEGNIPVYTDYVHLWWDQPQNLNDTSFTIPGLTGYNIYKDNAFLVFVEQPATEYFDLNLMPGIYNYHITAVYNLSLYGYPGETGESLKAGPVEIDNTWCYQLPFSETFNTGFFETNQWSVEGNNWRIAGQVGNLAPSAEFYFSPAATDYSIALTSFCINGTGFTDGNIMLTFDLKHTLVNATGAEFLAIEVFNGTSWIKVAEYSNIQNLNWVSRNINITSAAKGKRFQVRFRAYGSNSLDVFNWLLDNIRVYRECLPPLNLQIWIAFPLWNAVQISWEPPTGGGGGPSEWLGWDNGTNNDAIGLTGGGTFSIAARFTPAQLGQYAGSSLTKVRFFPYAPGTFVLKIWIGANAAQLVYAQPISYFTIGQWNEVVLNTPVYITAASELWFGYTVTHASGAYPAGVDAGPAVAGFGDMISLDGSVWESMATQYALNYNWNLNGYVESVDGVSTLLPIPDNTIYGPLSPLVHGNLPMSPDATVKESKNDTKSEREFISYNIWRDGELICNTTQNSYLDMDLMSWHYYCYNVTAVYEDCESEALYPDCILVRGITEIPLESFLVYPNPTDNLLNIEPGSDTGYLLIYNHTGQIVYEQSVTAAQTIRINVSNYNTGVYLVKLINCAGESFTRKVVVAR
jgi:hypothetical protein